MVEPRRIVSVAILLSVIVAAVPALAVDRPVPGALLRLEDPRARKKRKVRIHIPASDSIVAVEGLDPRVVGARLEVVGSGSGDGGTGAIVLPPSLWRGIGTPPGSKGFRYLDRTGSNGIKRAVLKLGKRGGSLVVRGGGRQWAFRVEQAQGPIDVRFGIGSELYCARFGDFRRNRARRVLARDAEAPDSCGEATAIRCGDARAEGVEECDDGNNVDEDGCSSDCELETPAAVCAGAETVSGTDITAVRVVKGLDRPVHLTAPRLEPGRLFVVEQRGRVRVLENDVLLPDVFLDIESKVSCCGERGLLSLAFHPSYEENGWVFVNYTNMDGDTVIARYELGADPDRIDPATEKILLSISQPYSNHNGGQIAFGPDGYLYVGMGDGGSAFDPQENAQDDGTLLGKLLRIDVDVVDPPYFAVPATNPDVAAPGELALVWAKGFRNPWRFSFDRAGGDLYVGDVGQNAWEEISFQPADSAGGENYGWDVFEGDGHCHEPTPPATECPAPEGFTMPIHEYANFDNPDVTGEGCSVTGGHVYRGCRMPDLAGTYFYSDFCSSFVRSFRVSNGLAEDHDDHTMALAAGSGNTINTVSSFGENARGEIYIADLGGEVFKIVPAE